MIRRLAAVALPVSLALSSSVVAAPFPAHDPVSMGMGGVGVAMPRPATGTLMNPAALSAMPESSRFNADLSAGVRAYDPDDLFNEMDDFQDADYVDRVDNVIRRLEDLTVNTVEDAEADLRDLSSAIDDLNEGLKRVSDRPVQAEVGASLGLNRPSRSLGVGVSYGAFGGISAQARYRDDALLSDLSREINECLDNINAGDDCLEADGFTRVIVDSGADEAEINFDTDDDLESSVQIRGLIMQEVGVTLSRAFDIAGYDVAIGITPKSQRVETFDYESSVDDADEEDFDGDDHTKSYSDMNVDIGAIVPIAEKWTVGLTVRNVISRGYKTVLGNRIEIGPQARLGVATERGWYRVGLDIDLNQSEPVGFEDGTQFVGAGIEFDTTRWLQTRLGYRVDLENSNRDTVSTGVGILIARTVNLDVGAAANSNEVGAALQLGLKF